MRQSRLEAMTPAADDIRPLHQDRSASATTGPVERCLTLFAGGAILFAGLRRRSLPLVLGGGALLYYGAALFGRIVRTLEAPESRTGLHFEETITVQKPVESVYSLWRRVENLPRFMSHLESVAAIDDAHSHWIARLPAPLRVEWDAETVEDRENQKISWRSLPGSGIEHSGSVFFHPVPTRSATEVKIILACRSPAGALGAAVAKLLSFFTEHQLKEDLRAFKAIVETGEKPTTQGQSAGGYDTEAAA